MSSSGAAGALACAVLARPLAEKKESRGSRGSIEEGEFLHRVMLAVSRPQLCFVRRSAGSNQRIRDLHSMASPVLPQVDARLTTRFFVDRNTCQRPEKIVQS